MNQCSKPTKIFSMSLHEKVCMSICVMPISKTMATIYKPLLGVTKNISDFNGTNAFNNEYLLIGQQ